MYYHEYLKLMEELAQSSSSWEESKAQQAQVTLKQMQVEANMMTNDTKFELLERIKVYRTNLKNLEKQIHDQQGNDKGFHHPPLTLTVHRTERNSAKDINPRTDSLLQSQNETLLQARKTMKETEEIGADITAELARNRETLQASRDKVGEVRTMTQQADSIVSRMNKWWNR